MVDQLASTGLTIDDYLTRLNSTSAELRVAISAVLDLSEDQPWGQLTRILVEHHQQLAELLQEIYSGLDPDQATGQTLDAVCSITGTYRQAATQGTVELLLGFTAGPTVIPAGSLVSVNGAPNNQWATDVAVNYVGPGAGWDPVDATAVTSGAVPALINTIQVIDTPIPNWSGVDNPAAAVTGQDRETDTELRLRRETEIATGGSTSVDAVAAAVSPLAGIDKAIVYENDDWKPAAPMPPHSIEVVYWGTPVAATLAETIFREKAGGVRPYGTAYTAHTDTQGNVHQIGSTLASEQVLIVRYSLTTDADYPGNADFSTAVAAAANADDDQLGIGQDVIWARYFDYGFNVAGVVDVTALHVNLAGAGWVAVNVAVGARAIATLIAGNVTVV